MVGNKLPRPQIEAPLDQSSLLPAGDVKGGTCIGEQNKDSTKLKAMVPHGHLVEPHTREQQLKNKLLHWRSKLTLVITRT